MSSGDKDNPDKIDNALLAKVMAMATVQRYMLRKYTLDRSRQIPYLAGYSTDGSTIYINRTMPQFWEYKGRKIATDFFLEFHERVEKALIDAIDDGDHDLASILPHRNSNDDENPYYPTHGVATAAEEKAVADFLGLDALPTYRTFMASQVKIAEQETLTDVPRDLDLTPYTPPETALDEKLLAEIKEAQG